MNYIEGIIVFNKDTFEAELKIHKKRSKRFFLETIMKSMEICTFPIYRTQGQDNFSDVKIEEGLINKDEIVFCVSYLRYRTRGIYEKEYNDHIKDINNIKE